MSGQMILNKSIERGDFKTGGEASSKLKDLLRKLGVESSIVRRITIVTYELEMNIIIHSKGGEIRAEVTPELIKVVAADKGPGIKDIERAFQPGYSTASDEIREMGFGAGMGLNNVQHYSDDLDVKSELGMGTMITACVSLGGESL
ncbi:MAG: ATP-binding protein [Halanaerobiaceae bacterium]